MMTLWFGGSVLAAAVPAGAAQTFLLDDFSQGHDFAWVRHDRTEETCDKPARYDASSGAYELESACDLLDGESDVFVAAEWVGIADPTFDDGYLRASAQHLTAPSELWINLRTHGNARTGLVGYRFRIPSSGTTLYIDRYWEHGSVETLASRTALSLMFEPGRPFEIKAGAVGSRLSLKVWSRGDEEPATPQIVASDARISAGAIAIGVSHDGESGAGAIGARFDDLLFVAASPDVNGDGAVDAADLVQILASWGDCDGCDADVNGDGEVDFADLQIVLSNWS